MKIISNKLVCECESNNFKVEAFESHYKYMSPTYLICAYCGRKYSLSPTIYDPELKVEIC